jgi:hypothetical protein
MATLLSARHCLVAHVRICGSPSCRIRRLRPSVSAVDGFRPPGFHSPDSRRSVAIASASQPARELAPFGRAVATLHKTGLSPPTPRGGNPPERPGRAASKAL